jgi:23S rRNA A2030 N6-methylase RlmJ
MKKIIKCLVNWLFSEEINQYKKEIERLKKERKASEDLNNFLRNIWGEMEVNLDHHYRSPSWAVICLQGKRADFIKLVELPEADMRCLLNFLQLFKRGKVNCEHDLRPYLRDRFIKM